MNRPHLEHACKTLRLSGLSRTLDLRLQEAAAARLTHAATGEGISYAMRSAQVMAKSIAAEPSPGQALYKDYTKRTERAFTIPLNTAVGFMNFVNTPAFGMVASLVTHKVVQTPLRYLLEHA